MLQLVKLMESLWKCQQSKEQLFLHRNCKYFFSTSKKIDAKKMKMVFWNPTMWIEILIHKNFVYENLNSHGKISKKVQNFRSIFFREKMFGKKNLQKIERTYKYLKHIQRWAKKTSWARRTVYLKLHRKFGHIYHSFRENPLIWVLSLVTGFKCTDFLSVEIYKIYRTISRYWFADIKL